MPLTFQVAIFMRECYAIDQRRPALDTLRSITPESRMPRWIVASMLALCIATPLRAQDQEAPNTILLLARPELRDPNFAGSVVMVLNNLGPSPAGLVVNRPTRVTVAQLFPEIETIAGRGDKVYFGGPVQLTSVVSFLFRSEEPPDKSVRVLEGVYMSTDRKLLGTLLARDEPMQGLRIFVGYSGWSRGQLEAEIARGDWTLAPADPDALFGSANERPWPDNARDVQATSLRVPR
jgi:putative transcriptional regulator